MAIETKRVNVQDKEVEITIFGARRALKIGRKIISILSPIIGGTDLTNLADLTLNNEVVEKLIKSITLDDKFEDFILELLSNTFVDGREVGKEIVFDEIFSGELSLLFGVLKEVLVVNYSSIFEKLPIIKAR